MNRTELLLVAALILGSPVHAAAQSSVTEETGKRLTQALEGDTFDAPSSELLASPGLAAEVSKRLAELGLTDPDALTPEQVLAACPDEGSQACKSIRRLLILRQALGGAKPGPSAPSGPNADPEGVRESLTQNAARSGGLKSLQAGAELSFDGAGARDAVGPGGGERLAIFVGDTTSAGTPDVSRGISPRAGRGRVELLGPTVNVVPGGPGAAGRFAIPGPVKAVGRTIGAVLSAVPEGIGAAYQGFSGSAALLTGTAMRVLGWGVEKGGEGVRGAGAWAGFNRVAAAGDWIKDKGLVAREAGSLTAGEGASLAAGSVVRGFNAVARPFTAPFSDKAPLDPTKGKLARTGAWVVDVFTDEKFKDLEPDYAGKTFAEAHSTDALADTRLKQAAAWGGGWGFYTTAATLGQSAGERFAQAVGTVLILRQLPASKALTGLGVGTMLYGSAEQAAHHNAAIASAKTPEDRTLAQNRALKAASDFLATLLGGRAASKGGDAGPGAKGDASGPKPHEVLGVSEGATAAEIMAAFRALAKRSHPDVNPGNPDAAGLFRAVAAAKDTMMAALDTPAAGAPGTSHVGAETRPAPPDAVAPTAAALRARKMAEGVPPQVQWANNTWDVEAVNPDGTVRLELEGSKDALYPLPLLSGSPVRYRGSEGQISSATQESIKVLLADGREVTLTAADLTGEAGKGLTVVRGGRELSARKADSDGTVRFSPLLPPGPPAVMRVPLQVLGKVPARLKGGEEKGLFDLTFDGGRLFATPRSPANGALPAVVTPEQVAGRHVELDSPEFGKVHVDSRRAALDRAARGTQKPTPDAASASPAFGALVGGKTLVGPGDAVLDGMVKHVGEVKGPLTTSLFELEVSDDGSAPGDRLLDALIAHAVGGPGKAPERVRIVFNNVRELDPRVAARVAEAKKVGADIEVVVPRNVSNDVQTVNHSKTLAGGDVGYLMTGGLSAKAASKVELGVSLPPGASRKLDEYLGLLAAPGSNTARRKAAAEDLARQGVVVNDPLLSQGGYLARAVNGLLHGAEKSLQVYVKELKDADSTRTLIERAREGVRVDVAVRNTDGIGEQSLKLMQDALSENPGLPLTLKVYPKKAGPLPHGNLIVADGSRAYLGTAFLWTSHMSGVMPGGRAFDHGVLLEGGDAARVHAQFREAVPTPEKDVLEVRDSGLWEKLTSAFSGTPARGGRAPKALGPEAEAAVKDLRAQTRAALEAEKGRLVRYLRVLRPGEDAGKAFDGLLSSADAMDIRLARPGELAAKASHVREKTTGREYVVMRTDVLGSSPEVRAAILTHELLHGAGFGEFTTHVVEAIIGGRGDAVSSDPHQVDQARLHKAMREGDLAGQVLKGYGVGKLAADGEPETLLRLKKESLKRARAAEAPADRRDALERVNEQRRAMGLRTPQDAPIVRQFERLKAGQKFTEADLAEALDLGRRVRAAGLPAKPFVNDLFYAAADAKALPEAGIMLRVADAAGGDAATRAKILDVFLAAAKTAGEPVDFKVGLFMKGMTGVQAGKFITVYTRDPVSARALVERLDAALADRGLPGAPPAEDFAFGRSGLVSWAAKGYKSREFSVPDGRGGFKTVRDDPARRPAVLDAMAHLPGMAPWVELAEATPQMARHREWTRGLEAAGREPAPQAPTAEQFKWYEEYVERGQEDTLDLQWKWAVVRFMAANPGFKP